MTANKTDVVRKLKVEIRSHRNNIATFAKFLTGHPVQALRQEPTGIFEDVARLEVYEMSLNALTDADSKATVETLQEYAREQIRLMASNPHANLLVRCELAAWARLIDPINGVF